MLIWKFTDSSVFNQWGKRLLLFSCKVMSDSATLWAVACQAPLSMGSSSQEDWSGLPFSSPGDLSDPGFKPESPASPVLQVDSYLWATREALGIRRIFFFFFSVYKRRCCILISCNCTKRVLQCVAEVDSTVIDYLKNTREGDILKLMLALLKVLYIIDALASLFPFNGQENPNSESLVKTLASLSRSSLC